MEYLIQTVWLAGGLVFLGGLVLLWWMPILEDYKTRKFKIELYDTISMAVDDLMENGGSKIGVELVIIEEEDEEQE